MKRADANVLHPTAESFRQDVLDAELPVIVDFWAPWCQPCLMLKPEIQRIAADLAGRARVALVNIDEQPQLANALGVQSIPTVLVFKQGAVVDGWIGLASRAAMLERLNKHVASRG